MRAHGRYNRALAASLIPAALFCALLRFSWVGVHGQRGRLERSFKRKVDAYNTWVIYGMR